METYWRPKNRCISGSEKNISKNLQSSDGLISMLKYISHHKTWGNTENIFFTQPDGQDKKNTTCISACFFTSVKPIPVISTGIITIKRYDIVGYKCCVHRHICELLWGDVAEYMHDKDREKFPVVTKLKNLYFWQTPQGSSGTGRTFFAAVSKISLFSSVVGRMWDTVKISPLQRSN